jgi:hypothetical protein
MMHLALAALASLLLAVPVDVSGKWSGSFKPDNEENTLPVFLVLKQDGATLTGTGGPEEGQQFPVQNGKIDGDRLIFEVNAGKGIFYFDLKLAEDEMAGGLQMKRDSETRTAKVSLKRVKP